LSEVIRGFRIYGRVQGVYFRHSTRIEAERLGVRGIARNLADGSVEVVVQGESAAVLSLYEWLKLGPVQARVDAVRDVEPDADILAELPMSFQVR
jgi:acylphosphatase